MVFLQPPVVLPRPILLVEDQANDAELALSTIRGEGYDIDWTQSGAAALYMLAQKSYRVAIVDVNLPGSGMHGWELSRRMRAVSPLLPICIYTGSHENLFGTIPGMPVMFLLKSARPQALIEVIQMTPP